jgi:excisionase family DNA binding protein
MRGRNDLASTPQYLNVSVAQVYALVRSGELPAIKIGGRGVWRVDRNKLEEFMDRLHDETSRWPGRIP